MSTPPRRLPKAPRRRKTDNQSIQQKLALMGVAERMKAAMKGSKSERAILIRDPNKLVSAAVLSSPKLTESEVENFAKLANVSEEVLRIIGQNRGWTKNYGVIAALTKNPKTPLAVSHAIRAAAQRSRPEDDRARSQPSGTAEARSSASASPKAKRRNDPDAVGRRQGGRNQAPLLPDHPRHDQTGLCEGDRPAEDDVDRRRARASGGLHGRPLADAIGLGKAGEKPDADEENEERKAKKE